MSRADLALRLVAAAWGGWLLFRAFEPEPSPPAPPPPTTWCDANGPIYGTCVLP